MNTSVSPIDLKSISTPRLDEYFGIWAIDEMRGMSMFGRVHSMNLQLHVAESETPKLRSSIATTGGINEPKIAVIPISGTMMKQVSSLDDATSTVALRRDVRDASNDPSVAGIMLIIDSPGGSVAGTDDLAADIRAASKKKPVYTFVQDLMASAALWVGTQATKVFANSETALVGSIGTFIGLYDVSQSAKMQGIQALVFKTGPLKGSGFPGTEINDDQKQYFQGIVDQTQTFFTKAVAQGRGLSIGAVEKMATGGVFMAREAMDRGLIDGIQTFEETLSALMQAASPQNKGGSSAATEIKPMNNNAPISVTTDAAKSPDATVKADGASGECECACAACADGNCADCTCGGCEACTQSGCAGCQNAKADPKVDPDQSKATKPDGAAFLAAFGDKGGKWFAEGKSFEECQRMHNESLVAENVALKARITELDQCVAQFRGAKAGAKFQPETPDAGKPQPQPTNLKDRIGDNLAKVAGSIRLPSSGPSKN